MDKERTMDDDTKKTVMVAVITTLATNAATGIVAGVGLLLGAAMHYALSLPWAGVVAFVLVWIISVFLMAFLAVRYLLARLGAAIITGLFKWLDSLQKQPIKAEE
jgi:hypothetical protein